MRNGKILSVKIVRAADTDPDTSYLGEYSNTPGPNAIARDNCGRGEYRYFNPAMSGEETGNPDSPQQDYERMESLNNGNWWYVGVIAKAQVQLSRNSTIQTIRSGGLWGIESDSGRDYVESVEKEELAALSAELSAIGFSDGQIKRAFDGVENSDA